MNDKIKNIWAVSGDIKVTMILILLLVFDLGAGFFSISGNEKLFRPLSDFGLIKWINTFGKTYPVHTIWFFALFILLSLFGINTFVCTTDRVIALIKNRRHFSNFFSFFLKFSVHIIHYSLIIILSGYLVSYLSPSICSNQIAVLNKKSNIPGTNISMILKSVNIDYYHGSRLKFLNNRAYNINADILFTMHGTTQQKKEMALYRKDKDNLKKQSGCCLKKNTIKKQTEKKIGLNSSFMFKNMSFTLKDFGPKYQNGMKQQPYISLIIKNNSGIKLYFAGTVLFFMGLIMYLYQFFYRQRRIKL